MASSSPTLPPAPRDLMPHAGTHHGVVAMVGKSFPSLQAFTIILFLLSGLTSLAHGHVPKSTARSRSKLLSDLQSCYTARQCLDNVGRHVTGDVDEDGSLASLVWVRLCKHLIHEQNQRLVLGTAAPQPPSTSSLHGYHEAAGAVLLGLTSVGLDVSRSSDNYHQRRRDAAVELTKAACVVSRLDVLSSSLLAPAFESIADYWRQEASMGLNGAGTDLQPHQLSGLKWAFDSFSLTHPAMKIPGALHDAYVGLRLPFSMIPAGVAPERLSVPALMEQVDFRVDEIRTQSNKVVAERRETAWQGDDGVPGFVYSSKCMPRQDWSSLVREVRDQLASATSQYYDCCLLNLYPNGDSGMRYHIDPDQGTLWDCDTAVVSVGATRRVAFRETGAPGDATQLPPHSFHALHGDVMYMFDDCQERFQHTVKKSDMKGDDAPRSSLVFKRTRSGTLQ